MGDFSKTTTIKLPIFNQVIIIFIGDLPKICEEQNEKYHLGLNSNATALSYYYNSRYYIILDDFATQEDILIHECYHIVNEIVTNLHIEDSEVFAYILGYLYKTIIK